MLIKYKTLVVFFLSFTAFAAQGAYPNKTHLFSKLNQAGIDQVVELPYNKSLISNIGKQVKVYNIHEMESLAPHIPEAKDLGESFADAEEEHLQRNVLVKLTYKVGTGECEFMEAYKVSDVLVCYRKAYINDSFLAPISGRGPRCVTTTSRLSHCYIFAHRVDEVLRALSK